MIRILEHDKNNYHIRVIKEDSTEEMNDEIKNEIKKDGKYYDDTLYLAVTEAEHSLKEVFAKIGKYGIENKQKEYDVDMSVLAGTENLEYFVAYGIVMGLYEFDSASNIESYHVNVFGGALKEVVLEECYELAKAIVFAKDMINMPSNHLRPLDFAQKIKTFLNAINETEEISVSSNADFDSDDNMDFSIKVEVIDAETLVSQGWEGLTSVGLSSEYPPCLVILRYKPLLEGEVFGMVGKGVTSDTGGYSIKQSMGPGIKGDMAGAASVVATIYAMAKNRVRRNVVAVLPICENRISSGSLLPGDVITMYDKTTVEIINTDAEGRLILADAIAYAVEHERVNQILDIATLTGQVFTMFGYYITGVLSSSDELFDNLEKASKLTKEHVIRLPYLADHEKMIEGTFSDLKNVGPSYCGTITAGVFLKHFTKELPWIHLDIAGTAWVDSPLYAYHSVGATGNPISTLYYMMKGE